MSHIGFITFLFFCESIHIKDRCEVNFGILVFWDFGEKSPKIPKKHQKNPKIFFTQNICIFKK